MIIAHHYLVNSGIMDAFEVGSTSTNYVFLTLWGMWGKTGINVFVLISGYFAVYFLGGLFKALSARMV